MYICIHNEYIFPYMIYIFVYIIYIFVYMVYICVYMIRGPKVHLFRCAGSRQDRLGLFIWYFSKGVFKETWVF